MQYEPTLSRDELVDLAINKYFGNVDKKNMAGVLDCFNEGGMMCVQTDFVRHAGKAEVERMFEDFFSTWETILHHQFITTVDEKNGRIAACFEAVLTDADGGRTVFNNTNFWRVRDGKFQEVYIYFSGPNVLV